MSRERHAHSVALLGAFMLVFACGTSVSAQSIALKHQPVPGWPELRIETRYVARIAMRGYCFPVAAGTPIPESHLVSCARPDFWRGVCDIFIDVQQVMSAELREHEEWRCRGYDREDSDLFAEALRAWREHGENRYADMLNFESLLFVWESN